METSPGVLDKGRVTCSNKFMKKIISALSLFSFLAAVSPVFAKIPAGIKTVEGVIPADTSIGRIVTLLVAFIIVLATLAALLYIVIGALQWIMSGGDKQKVADARNHIIAAVIGLVVIALSFVIINVVIQTLGLGSLATLEIPALKDIPQ